MCSQSIILATRNSLRIEIIMMIHIIKYCVIRHSRKFICKTHLHTVYILAPFLTCPTLIFRFCEYIYVSCQDILGVHSRVRHSFSEVIIKKNKYFGLNIRLLIFRRIERNLQTTKMKFMFSF